MPEEAGLEPGEKTAAVNNNPKDLEVGTNDYFATPSALGIQSEESKPYYAFNLLVGLLAGLIFGALIGTLLALFGLGTAQSWNDPGGIMGGHPGEAGPTFAQTMTVLYGIVGAVLGGACGFITGLLIAFRRRPSKPNKSLDASHDSVFFKILL